MMPLRILCAIIVLMTFDDLIIKYLDFRTENFNTARYTVDAVYVFTALIILIKRWPSPMIRPLTFISILFFFLTVISTSIIRDDYKSNLEFLYVTLRYIPIGAALATFDRRDLQATLGTAFRTIFVIQFISSVPQILRIDAIVNILLPQQIDGIDTRISKDFQNWDGAIFGTFNENISLAFFLMIYIIFQKYENRKSIISADIIISTTLIYFTQSFAALSAILLLAFYWRFGWIGILIGGIIGIFSSTILATIIYINGFSIQDYILISETSRLGIIIYTLPSYLNGSSFSEIVLGIGRNVDAVRAVVFSANYVPEIFILSKNMAPLEDVYYVAIFMYYGILGIVMYFLLFGGVILYVLKNHKLNGTPFLTVSLIFAVVTWINQITSVQILSVLFWALAGLAVSRSHYTNEKLHD